MTAPPLRVTAALFSKLIILHINPLPASFMDWRGTLLIPLSIAVLLRSSVLIIDD